MGMGFRCLGLEKKQFKGAREAINEVLAVDRQRRDAQQQLDKNLNEQKQQSGQIGRLMKEGRRDEAEQAKQAAQNAFNQAKDTAEQALNTASHKMR